MTPSNQCYSLIKKFEGCVLHAYKDAVGIWTIGYGATFYEDGSQVKDGDIITQERAEALLKRIVDAFAVKVDTYTNVVEQHQFDALVSFAYNVGVGAYHNSTLLKKVNANPNDLEIRAEFLKWNKAGGRVLSGLTDRRKKEAAYYFSA